MVRPRKSVVLGVLAAIAGGEQAVAQYPMDCANPPSPVEAKMDTGLQVATPDRPAAVVPKAGVNLASHSPALRLTLQPTAADPDSPFVVAVFASNSCENKGKQPGQFIGTVSFLPAKTGQSQVFVLPAPEHGFPSIRPEDVQLTVKLISANPARPLGNVAVDVLGAEFSK
jgi:hypothetical protein